MRGKGIGFCSKVTDAQVDEMTRLEDQFIESRAHLSSKLVSLPSGPSLRPPIGSMSSTSPSDFAVAGLSSRKKRCNGNPISDSFDVKKRDQLDCEIARMFYTAGLPFNLARNPYFLSSYGFAADNNIAGYIPPGFNRLRTTLLQQEKCHVDKLLEPIRKTWPERGITIVSDGWSDPQRRPLINFMVVAGGGPMFIKSVNCAGEVKDKRFIAGLLKEVVHEVGHQNVVQIVTDNARNCKGAGEIIENLYPHIYWTPCVVHTLNLALKNICAAKNVESNQETYVECHWITEIHSRVLMIKNFIMNHGMRLSMYTKFTTLKMLSLADTRFASVVIMLKRFKLVRRALESSDQWSLYKDDDPIKARIVRDTIVDESWWEDLSYIVDFTSPIYDMIRACDTDKPCLHLVYEMWDSMIEKVRKVIYKHENKNLDDGDDSSFYDIVHGILVSRWAKNNTPLHCLAHSLNPRYYSDSWLAGDPTRVPPHRDVEVSAERTKCFRRIFPDSDLCKRAISEYALFSLKADPFDDAITISLMDSEDPKFWWANFGAPIPLLEGLAFKVLGQPTSSSCCERNWSTYSFIHSMKRNRLTPTRAEDLVFTHNNLRLLSRNSPTYSHPKSKMWDVGGDQFGTLEETGILEFAELSLDEPNLEEEFVSDNI